MSEPGQDLHLPRAASGPPRRRTRRAGRSPSFCDLEEHNALTAHQERQRLASRANPNHEETE